MSSVDSRCPVRISCDTSGTPFSAPALLTDTAGFKGDITACRWQLLRSPNQWTDSDIAAPWDYHVLRSEYVQALRQSRPYLEHLNLTHFDLSPGDAPRCGVAVLRAFDGQVAGIVPFHESLHSLARAPLRTMELLGSAPILPAQESGYDRLFSFFMEEFPENDGVALRAVPQNSFIWDYLQHSAFLQRHFFVHLGTPWRRFDALQLPAQYSDYLACFKRKKRYNIQRQERLLQLRFGNALTMQKVEHADDVGLLTGAIAAMRQTEGLLLKTEAPETIYETPVIPELAKRGLLRSYFLRADGRLLALIFGCQHGKVYEVFWTWFNRHFAAYSPGTALWHMVLRELIASTPTRVISLGYGVPSEEHFGSNDFTDCASVVVIRKTMRNRMLKAARNAYRSLMSIS